MRQLLGDFPVIIEKLHHWRAIGDLQHDTATAFGVLHLRVPLFNTAQVGEVADKANEQLALLFLSCQVERAK